jgi:hypothetical protein
MARLALNRHQQKLYWNYHNRVAAEVMSSVQALL